MKTTQNHNCYEKKLDQRVRASLLKKEDRFAQEHQNDTDEQLLDYLHTFANELGHTPNACEIIGGRLIEKRFGNWNRAVLLAGLSWTQSAPPMQSRLIYRQERELQERMFTKERAGSKKEREAARHKKAEEDRLTRQLKLERDMIWGQHHEEDTDDQLLQYLRNCALELGHTPVVREVEGGGYIAKRFINWPLALQLAELPLPKGMLPAKEKDLNKYHQMLRARSCDSVSPNNGVRKYSAQCG